MTRLRRVLAPVAAIWLLCQVGTVGSVPVSLWLNAADPHAAECTCGHEAATCPMHHKPTGGSAPCAMQAAKGSGTAILTTLVGLTGLIVEPTASIRPAIPSVHVRAGDVHVTGERPVPPDPPPPRI